MLPHIGSVEGMDDYEIEALAKSHLTNVFDPDPDQTAAMDRCQYENGLRDRQAVMDVLLEAAQLFDGEGLVSPPARNFAHGMVSDRAVKIVSRRLAQGTRTARVTPRRRVRSLHRNPSHVESPPATARRCEPVSPRRSSPYPRLFVQGRSGHRRRPDRGFPST